MNQQAPNKTMILMRHGNKQAGKGSDPVLTEKGWLQAIMSGQNGTRLTRSNIRMFDFRVSPAKRTIETALLAISQCGFVDTPSLKLEPLMFEVNEGEHCWGTKKDELVGWINGRDIQMNLMSAVDHAADQGLVLDHKVGPIKSRIGELIRAMDISAIEDVAEQEWWPGGQTPVKGDEATYETADAVMERVGQVKSSASPQTLFSVTHSTTIAVIVSKLSHRFSYSASPVMVRDAQCKPSQVAEAGVYEIDSWNTRHYGLVKAYDPSLDLEM